MGTPRPGDTHLHRYEIHKRVATRLRGEHGVTSVAAAPSPMRPVRVVATLDRMTFFDQQSDTGEATLEFEWRPSPERDEFRIQYTEPGTPWACGWHQDRESRPQPFSGRSRGVGSTAPRIGVVYRSESDGDYRDQSQRTPGACSSPPGRRWAMNRLR